jgi:hypothetical protein
LEEIARRPAVTVDGESLDGADLILIGILAGEWLPFEARVQRGLELESREPDAITGEDVRREATAFRQGRALISAADFRAWLGARGLTVADVSGVLRRRLLRQEHDSSAIAGDAGINGVLAAEAYCDGVLQRAADVAIRWLAAGKIVGARDAASARRLDDALTWARAAQAAAIATLTDSELRARLERLLSLREALERLRGEVADPVAVERRMKHHGLDWLELVGDELSFDREGGAREARLLIASDGETPGDVAGRAEVAVAERRLLAAEAPAALEVSFAAAAVGEVVGPWEEGGRWRVMQVRAKTPPSAANASLRERAIEELVQERTARHATGRTTIHVEL